MAAAAPIDMDLGSFVFVNMRNIRKTVTAISIRGKTDTSGFWINGNRMPVGMINARVMEHSPAVAATASPGKNPSSMADIIAGKNAMVTLTIGRGMVPMGVKARMMEMAIISPVMAIVRVFARLFSAAIIWEA